MDRRTHWIADTGVVIAIIGTGIAIGGALQPNDDGSQQQTTQARVESEPLPADIPGCDSVVPAGQSASLELAPRGAIPSATWLTGAKAQELSDVLRRALPPDLEVASEPPAGPYGPRALMFSTTPGDTSSAASASAKISRNELQGVLTVDVGYFEGEPDPCVRGNLDRRQKLGNGSVLDTLATWQEANGLRSYTHLARLYTAEGEVIQAASSSPAVDPASSTDTVPLTVDELVSVASDPALRPPPHT